jgi:hypothetical protein
MIHVIEVVGGLARDDGFAGFQNSLVRDFYDVLGQGFALNENEVRLVERLVGAANGRSYGPLRILSTMLHGTRSFVEFNYLDKPVTKELGDMALITVVTSGATRIVQRLCIVQNKKTTTGSWHLDLEQLFLLKNFPPFAGNRGIFKGVREFGFRNASGCLGAFGLLLAPGEMIFAAAPLISEMAKGKASLSMSDISVIGRPDGLGGDRSAWSLGLPLGPWAYPEKWLKHLDLLYHHFGPPFWPGAQSAAAFLPTDRFSRDLYDLTRSLTQLCIGEFTFADGEVLNRNADAFANLLLRKAGFGDLFAGGHDNLLAEMSFDGQMAVIVAHLDLERAG